MANLWDVDFSHSFAQIIYKPIYKILNCLCKPKLKTIDDANWKAKVWNDTGQENGKKLGTYRLYKSYLIAEDYVKIDMERSHRRIIAEFRSRSLPNLIKNSK